MIHSLDDGNGRGGYITHSLEGGGKEISSIPSTEEGARYHQFPRGGKTGSIPWGRTNGDMIDSLGEGMGGENIIHPFEGGGREI